MVKALQNYKKQGTITNYDKESVATIEGCNAFTVSLLVKELLADTKFFLCDECTVAVDVLAHEVVKETTTLTNKHLE